MSGQILPTDRCGLCRKPLGGEYFDAVTRLAGRLNICRKCVTDNHAAETLQHFIWRNDQWDLVPGDAPPADSSGSVN